MTDTQKRQRLAIKIISAISLLSLFSWTMTALAWGTADTTIYFLLLYPILFITTILIIANKRLSYFAIILIALIYVILLNRDVGEFLVFTRHNNVLYLVLALPYFALLTLVPLTITYLTSSTKYKKALIFTAFLIALGFPAFAIGERYNMDYMSYAFIDAEINSQGQVILNCKPGFADARTFTMTTNSEIVANEIKKYGEYYQGSYFLHTTIKKTFRFSNLKSVTLIKIDSNYIVPQLTWTINEIKGDMSFLEP